MYNLLKEILIQRKLYLVFLILFLFLTGCGKKSEAEYKIGVSQCSNDDWRMKMNGELRREALMYDDVEMEILSADDSPQKQVADLRYFIDNDFDIILVSPTEGDSIAPIVKEAMQRGIPVVTYDRGIDNLDVTAHMEVDNYVLGKSAAEYARSILKDNINVIEIEGVRTMTPTKKRHEGFQQTLSSYPNVKVLTSISGNWKESEAAHIVDSLLRIYPHTNLIYAHNDRMAIGASKSAVSMGRDDITIIGIDGSPEIGIKAVSEGVIDATVLYPTEGELVFRIAMAVLKGDKYERLTTIVPLSPVDRSNADILLAQYRLINSEGEKINKLKATIDEYWERHSAQTVVLYSMIVILVLLGGLLFMGIRIFVQHRRHQARLMEKNRQLEVEKEKQEQLYVRLEAATNSKLMFFTNVSHDLRTPLTLISAPVEKVANEDYLSPKDRDMMRLAAKNVRILKNLIDQILDFMKYENGKMELNLSETDVYQLVSNCVESFKEESRKRDIRLSFEAGLTSASYNVAVDQGKLERVLFNLIGNAFKYTPDNGRIKVSLNIKDDVMTLSVADSGCGISEDDCKHIFDRFYQVDKVNAKGSGIGLALSKGFIELHGGDLTVESELGKGSRFIVTLPVRHVNNGDGFRNDGHTDVVDNNVDNRQQYDDRFTAIIPEEELNQTIDPDKPLLLVIDDNKDILQLVRDILEDKYSLLYACNGKEGLRMAAKYVPDLIICDVMMPEMDGMQCVEKLKSEITTSHIPVLMLTACSREEQRIKGYKSGADAYLPKPFNAEMLIVRCANLLKNRRLVMDHLGEARYSVKPNVAPNRELSDKKTPIDIESEFYSRFLSIIHEEMSDPDLSVESIAMKMGLGQSQFTRKIKALSNYTPVEIIRKERMRRGRKLLMTTEKSIGEISYEVGFTSPAYFTKCYKDEYGETPKESRR